MACVTDWVCDERMTNYWTETVKRLTPYVPGEQRSGASITKLNTNENPYPPAPAVLQAIRAVSGDQLRRYPDPESVELRSVLAEYHGLNLNQVFVGNGSDEVLALAFLAYFTNGRPLQFPDISYSFYPVYCDLYGIEPQMIPLEPDYNLALERFEANIGGIIFPNPNAPTARAVPAAAVSRLLDRHTEQVLLVDEAYADFGGDSVVGLINTYPNLLVSHTFSKGRSLAGMRLGVAFGHPSLIEGLQRVKNSFNSYPVDALAQAPSRMKSITARPSQRSCRHASKRCQTCKIVVLTYCPQPPTSFLQGPRVAMLEPFSRSSVRRACWSDTGTNPGWTNGCVSALVLPPTCRNS